MKTAGETVGTADQLVNFGEATKALKEGKMVKRSKWEVNFIFEQVPSRVPIDIVPKMTSLPDSVKKEFSNRLHDAHNNGLDITHVSYKNQLAMVGIDNVITSYCPSTNDAMAEDWVVLD